jgi:hypothetical protein
MPAADQKPVWPPLDVPSHSAEQFSGHQIDGGFPRNSFASIRCANSRRCAGLSSSARALPLFPLLESRVRVAF